MDVVFTAHLGHRGQGNGVQVIDRHALLLHERDGDLVALLDAVEPPRRCEARTIERERERPTHPRLGRKAISSFQPSGTQP